LPQRRSPLLQHHPAELAAATDSRLAARFMPESKNSRLGPDTTVAAGCSDFNRAQLVEMDFEIPGAAHHSRF